LDKEAEMGEDISRKKLPEVFGRFRENTDLCPPEKNNRFF